MIDRLITPIENVCFKQISLRTMSHYWLNFLIKNFNDQVI